MMCSSLSRFDNALIMAGHIRRGSSRLAIFRIGCKYVHAHDTKVAEVSLLDIRKANVQRKNSSCDVSVLALKKASTHWISAEREP